MILSYFGKKLVQLHSDHVGHMYSNRAFFNEVFFPVIYEEDPPLNRFAHNSKFRYAKTRQEGLINFHEALQVKKEFHTGTIFGYPAIEPEATTAGQVTSLHIPVNEEDAYASWIGDALAIEVERGISIIIDHPLILQWIHEGWKEYREFLKQTPKLAGQQIRKWNAYYLVHKIKNNSITQELEFSEKDGSLTPLSWSRFIILLARILPAQTLMCYAYGLDKSGNTTIGFIPIHLPKIHKLYKAYNEIFSNIAELKYDALEKIVTQFEFRTVCKRGYIGLHSLEPKGIDQFISSTQLPDKNKKYHNPIHLYHIWIIAMLEDQKLLELSKQVAQNLNSFVQKATQGSNTNTRIQVVKDVLASGSKQKLISNLTLILESEPNMYLELNKLIELTLKQTSEQLRLLLVLIKFHYVGISKSPQPDLFN